MTKTYLYIKTENMTKAPVTFKKSPHKMVGGVAHTRYMYPELDVQPRVRKQPITVLYFEFENELKF